MDGFSSTRRVFSTARVLLFGALAAFLFWVRPSSPSLLVAGTTPAPIVPLSEDSSRINSPPRVPFDTLHEVSDHVFRHTNETRREQALSPLRNESTLTAIACAHASDMFRRDYVEHKNPKGELPQDRVAKMHRRLIGGVAENLYEQINIEKEPDALATQMVEKWKNSPPHRKNILDPYATHLGVCVLQRKDTLLATQLFAKVVAYLADPFPRTVEPGETLTLSIEQTFPPNTSIVQYDFWDPSTETRASGPRFFNGSVRVPDTTGTLRLRFYVMNAGRYRSHQGPEVTIRSSQ